MNRATPDNANPTILSLSQLPTREKTKAAGRTALRKGPESRYDDVLFARPDYLSLLPSSETASWSTQSDSSSDDDRFTTEPIDEQEIYGT